MTSYLEQRGRVTGMTLWRVETEAGNRRILPDGAMDIMWFEGRFQFAGPDTTAMIVRSGQPAVTWGLRLPPGVAHAVLSIPARELADQRFALDELASVPASIADAAVADPPAALERIVNRLWQRAAPEPVELRLAASLDQAIRARLSVPEIAVRHGMSERSLRRASDRIFGYGPKTLSTIHRFQQALILARGGADLCRASITAGYADQSHLNRDSRRLAGATPAELLGRHPVEPRDHASAGRLFQDNAAPTVKR